MRIKTNRQQLEGLSLLLGIMLDENRPNQLAGLLVHLITHQIWQKIRRKSDAISAKDWSVTLTETEAVALVLYWEITFPPLGYDYEVLQMQRITNDLQTKIANNY